MKEFVYLIENHADLHNVCWDEPLGWESGHVFHIETIVPVKIFSQTEFFLCLHVRVWSLLCTPQARENGEKHKSQRCFINTTFIGLPTHVYRLLTIRLYTVAPPPPPPIILAKLTPSWSSRRLSKGAFGSGSHLMTHVWSRSTATVEESVRGLIPTHPVNIPCGRKPEYPEKSHDFRQSVDGL